ncbi:TPA: hypothetical protein HA337_00750 [Desulfurococcaceae archaeon]|nr:hypothetical protein [Desulfurococcaceae archaeon]
MRAVRTVLFLTLLPLALASPLTTLTNLTNALNELAARPLPPLSVAAISHSNVSYVKGALEVTEEGLKECLDAFANLSKRLDSELRSTLVSPFDAFETLGKLTTYYDCATAWTKELEKVIASMPVKCNCTGNETRLVEELANAKSVSEVLRVLKSFNDTDVERAMSCYACEALAKARLELIDQLKKLKGELVQMNETLAMFRNLLVEYIESLK